MINEADFDKFLLDLIDKAVHYGLSSSPQYKMRSYQHVAALKTMSNSPPPSIESWVKNWLSTWLKVRKIRTMYRRYLRHGPPKRLPNTERLFIYEWDYKHLPETYGSKTKEFVRKRDEHDYKALALALKEVAREHSQKFQEKRQKVIGRVEHKGVAYVRAGDAAIYLLCSTRQVRRKAEQGVLEKAETGMITTVSLKRVARRK